MSNNNKNTNCWRKAKWEKWMRGKNKRTIKVFPFNIFFFPSISFHFIIFYSLISTSTLCFSSCFCLQLSRKKSLFLISIFSFFFCELLWRPITSTLIHLFQTKRAKKSRRWKKWFIIEISSIFHTLNTLIINIIVEMKQLSFTLIMIN